MYKKEGTEQRETVKANFGLDFKFVFLGRGG